MENEWGGGGSLLDIPISIIFACGYRKVIWRSIRPKDAFAAANPRPLLNTLATILFPVSCNAFKSFGSPWTARATLSPMAVRSCMSALVGWLRKFISRAWSPVESCLDSS